MHNALSLLNIPIFIALVMERFSYYKSKAYKKLSNSGEQLVYSYPEMRQIWSGSILDNEFFECQLEKVREIRLTERKF